MKNLFILIIICMNTLNYYSQIDSISNKFKKEIDVNYNWSHIGRNLSINYNQYVGRHAIIIGVKQHYNNGAITDNQNYAYKNRGYATNFSESIGLNIGYKFDLLRKNGCVMPYVFFQSQISNIRFRTTYDNPEVWNNGLIIKTYTETSKQMFVTENYFGFGLKVKLFKNIFLNQTIGGGIATFKRSEAIYNNRRLTKYDFELCSSIKIGLIYQFK